MKVLTIKQPYASLIAHGFKKYEFRTWKTKYRGNILIHAGKVMDKKAMERFKHLNLKYPLGQIIAKATITDCVLVDDNFREEMTRKDPIVYKGLSTKENWNGYGFKLENVKEIDSIKINGKLSLWDYDYEQ